MLMISQKKYRIKVDENTSPRVRVIKGLRQALNFGIYSPGEKIGSEEQIAAEYGVSRMTARAAIKELVEEGLLVSEKYRGYFVSSSLKKNAFLSRNFILATHVKIQNNVYDGIGKAGQIELGVLTEASIFGMHPLVLGESGFSDGCFELFINGMPLGIIISDYFYNDFACLNALKSLRHLNFPVVIYGDSKELSSYVRVISDHEAGSSLLTRSLIERGCKRILRLWTVNEDIYWIKGRNLGYEKTVKDVGLSVIPPVYVSGIVPPDKEGNENFKKRSRTYAGYLAEYLTASEPIDGILLTSDSDFFPVAAACRLCGKIPGKDILICGYDNYWKECIERSFEESKPFATIEKEDFLIGKKLFSKLLELIKERESGLTLSPSLEKIKPQLIKTEENK